jgi:hypothetical protein
MEERKEIPVQNPQKGYGTLASMGLILLIPTGTVVFLSYLLKNVFLKMHFSLLESALLKTVGLCEKQVRTEGGLSFKKLTRSILPLHPSSQL